MNFEEHAAKPLLAGAGIAVPEGRLARSADEAERAATALGPVMVKAQVAAGKRGKAGGIKSADTPEKAADAAAAILGMVIGGHRVESLLVEEKTDIADELYAAVLNDPASKGPLVMFSTEGGMDIEEVAAASPEKVKKTAVDIRSGFGPEAARALVSGQDLGPAEGAVAETLEKLYAAYVALDVELLEINPLAVTGDGRVVALDCKLVMDDSAIQRQADAARLGTPEVLTELETRAEGLDFKYIEFDGDVAVLANGAGLTMTTMDVIRHHGGRPANFCEIGGHAYTKGKVALELVLSKPGIKSLAVIFCGAIARCDVMMEGLLAAWEESAPGIPVSFSIAGTGDSEAIALLKDRLGIEPHPDMDAACRAAVAAAAGGSA